MRVRSLQDEAGFSLVELLIVVVIIGILAGIAIPRFLQHRQASFDSAAVSDLRNLIAVETGLLTSDGSFSQSAADMAAADWNASPGVRACALTANGGQEVTLAAWHVGGGTVYSWNSTTTMTSSVVATVPADCGAAIAPGAAEVS